jgi:Ion channel
MASNLPFREGRHRLSVAHLLAALTALFVVMPFVDRLHYGELVESVVFTLALLTAVNAVGGRRRTRIAAAVLAVPALVARWLTHLWPDSLVNELSLLAAAIFVAFVIVHLFRFVVSAPVVNAEVLCAAISVYLLFAVAYSFLYSLVAWFDPKAFNFTAPAESGNTMRGFTAVYYSLETLTMLAFGDILPASNVARMLTLVQATAGIFYMAILVARLVGIYSSQPPADQARQ